MCTGAEIGLLVASTAVSAGGAAANAKNQNDAINAQNAANARALEIEKQARREEETRQLGFERASVEEVAKALNAVDPEGTVNAANQAANDPEGAFARSAGEHNNLSLPGEVRNSDVEGSLGRIVSDAIGKTKKKVGALASLSKLGTISSGVNDQLGRLSSDIQTFGVNRRASLNASRLATSIPANRVTPSSSVLGDVLLAGGQLGGGIAGKKIGTAGGKIPTLGDLLLPDFRNVVGG